MSSKVVLLILALSWTDATLQDVSSSANANDLTATLTTLKERLSSSSCDSINLLAQVLIREIEARVVQQAQFEIRLNELQQLTEGQTEVRNVALGAVATCSSTYSNSYTCGMAVDGIEECVWASRHEGKGNWIKIDFGHPRVLTEGRFMQRKGTVERNKDIKLEFSDGSVQQFQLSYHNSNSWVWDDIKLTPVRTTWVKITTLTVWSTVNNGWAEIQFSARVRKDLPTPDPFGSLTRSNYKKTCGG